MTNKIIKFLVAVIVVLIINIVLFPLQMNIVVTFVPERFTLYGYIGIVVFTNVVLSAIYLEVINYEL